jgi:pre-rRNA-processing protein TSR1
MTPKIVAAPLPRQGRAGKGDMDVEPEVLHEPSADDADSLVSTNDPDDMENEQTWPTEDEMRAAGSEIGDRVPDAANGTTPKRVRKVPKGTSSYQAAWIVDEEDDQNEANPDAPIDADVDVDAEPEEEMEDLPEVAMDADDTETDRRTVQFQDLEDDVEKEQ